MYRLLNYFLLLILFTFLILIYSINLNAQILSYNEVKSKGIMLETESKTHQIFLILGNLTSEYLSCDVYIFGKSFLDFSSTDYLKLIFSNGFSKIFIQFATYKKTFNQSDLFQFCETFQIRFSQEDINKILELKKENLYLQFTGKYGILEGRLVKKLISTFERISFQEDQSQINIFNTFRPFSFFTIIYPFNIYYSFDNQDNVIKGIAISTLWANNITLEVGFYLKLKYLGAFSIYYSSVIIYDNDVSYENSKTLGLKTYLTVFDIPEVCFLRFSLFFGLGSYDIEPGIITESFYFSYFLSMTLGFPVSPAVEYILSFSLGRVESDNLSILLQLAMIVNLF